MLRTERRAAPRGGPASEEDALRHIEAAVTAISADEALAPLLEGSRRWVDGELAHPNRSIERRQGFEAPLIADLVAGGRLRVVGGYYSFDSGAVSILD